jgi:hypothetical protein
MTTQKKNTMMPGMAYPATVLALATAVSYPSAQELFGAGWCRAGHSQLLVPVSASVLGESRPISSKFSKPVRSSSTAAYWPVSPISSRIRGAHLQPNLPGRHEHS